MLQRAAGNAYSWWWASHIRTKQSKWLEQSLQDMEEKVEHVLNLIQKDGDSFAKRAEMYYKHRPELIGFVEETVRAYRALAERYDKLSTDLQKANTTIASICPDRVTYDTDYDDDDDYNDGPSKMLKNFPQNTTKIPKIPKPPSKDLKGLLNKASKTIQATKSVKTDPSNHVPKSGLTKDEALEEIDKLQKNILGMQTMKEFMKSSYESSLAQYWDTESKIMELQQRICSLQDEFQVSKVIEDDDARTLMAEAALKSCEETLDMLQEKQEKSSQDARLEHQRIDNAKQKFKSLKHEFDPDQADDEEEKDVAQKSKSYVSNQDNQKELEAKIKESFEGLSKKPLTVTELAETIDKLVNKVISLETSVSSQTALIDMIRTEANDLQTQIRKSEDNKAALIGGALTLDKKLKYMEEKLNGVQDLDQNVESQNKSLKTRFSEASRNLDHMSENFDVKLKDDVDVRGSSLREVKLVSEEPVDEKEIPCTNDHGVKNAEIPKNNKDITKGDDASNSVRDNRKDNEINDTIDESEKPEISSPQGEYHKVKDGVLESKSHESDAGEKDDMSWQQMLLSGLEDKEKILLEEYITILRNYNNTKKKLSEEEDRNQGTLSQMTGQVRQLKSAIVKRDNEIRLLKQKLKLLQDTLCKDRVDIWQEEKDSSDDVASAENEDDIKVTSIDESQAVSAIEKKLRTDIDAILDENLDFWLRFSTAFHQVQKFKTEVEDLQQEVNKVKAKAIEGKSRTSMFTTDLRSDIRPIYKHLKEIKNELTAWLEQSTSLKEELQMRCSSLSNIQEEIKMALSEGVEEEEIKFSTHQAAKFQGEILNMKQENNKVNEELQAGIDHVTALKLETEKTLERLEEEFSLSDRHNQPHQGRSPGRSGIPLRSFIFGVKAKKQKPSIFACISHHRKFSAYKGGSK